MSSSTVRVRSLVLAAATTAMLITGCADMNMSETQRGTAWTPAGS